VGTVSKAISPVPDSNCAAANPPVAGIMLTSSCVTKNMVTAGEAIAVVGDSGAAAGHPHLHLQADGGTRNALFWVEHDQSDFNIESITLDPAPTHGTLVLGGGSVTI